MTGSMFILSAKEYLAVAGVSILLAVLSMLTLLSMKSSRVLLDEPNHRSLHSAPKPRAGGIAIFIGILPAAVYAFFQGGDAIAILLSGWLLVFGVSLLDDLFGLPFWVRLLVHAVAAALVVYAAGPMNWLLRLIALFWIVWATNLFNFMDGMDGLAGTMAVVGGLALVWAIGQTAGSGILLVLLIASVAAVTGFLGFNLPPARIFMGDAGAAPLGFLLSAVSLLAIRQGALSGWLPFAVFAPFIVDASLTLLRRIWLRQAFWRAHREHVYQRLVLAGIPVPKVLTGWVVVIFGCAVAALVLDAVRGPGWGFLVGLVLLLVLVYWSMIRLCAGRRVS